MAYPTLPIAGHGGEIHIPVPRRSGAVGTATVPAPPAPAPAPTDPEPPEMPGLIVVHAAWVLPALAMFTVGAIGLNAMGLWSDELASWGMTTVSWSEVWRQLGGTDATIGAYYVVLRLWTGVFGDSDVALRMPSLLAMAGAAAVIGRIGTRLVSPRVGLVAGLSLAVLPMSTRYAQEARPYALAVLLAAVATLMFVRLLDRLTFQVGAAYALSVVALGLIHLVGLLLVVAHGVALVTRPKLLWRWTPTVFAAGLVLLPMLLIGRRQSGQVSWVPLSNLDSLRGTSEMFFGALGVTGAILALALAAVGRDRPAVVAASVAFVPVGLLFVVGFVAHIYQDRYLLFTFVGWTLLVGLTLGRRGWTASAVTLVAVAALGLPGQVSIRTPAARLQDTRAAAALIADQYREGDGIVYGLADHGPGVLNRDILAHYVPPERRPTDLLVDRPMRTDGWMVASECTDLAACLGQTARLWVLRLGDYGDPLDGLDGQKPDVLRAGYTVANTWHTAGLTVALLTRKSAT
jgi:mannosyltransferase